MDNLMTDEVIKRRLLIDGDGVGDDRRLVGLYKTYVDFCMDTKQTKEERMTAFRRIQAQLRQVQMAARRTHESVTVNIESKNNLSNFQVQVQEEVEGTKKQIVESKALLEEATKHRKYSMEYDALAKLIQSKPDRKETETKRIELENELQALRARKNNLDKRLVDRKRTVSMLSAMIESLTEQLRTEEAAAAAPETPPITPTASSTATVTPTEESSKEEISPMEVDPSPSTAIMNASSSLTQTPMESQAQPALSSASGLSATFVQASPKEEKRIPIDLVSKPMEVEETNVKMVAGTSAATAALGTESGPDKEKEKYEDLSESEGEAA